MIENRSDVKIETRIKYDYLWFSSDDSLPAM